MLREARTPTPKRRLLPVAKVSTCKTPRRKAAKKADASRRATREERKPFDWSDKFETECLRLSSVARRSHPAAKISGREQIVK